MLKILKIFNFKFGLLTTFIPATFDSQLEKSPSILKLKNFKDPKTLFCRNQ